MGDSTGFEADKTGKLGYDSVSLFRIPE